MTDSPSLFDGVDVLVPARFQRARREATSQLRADLSALIEALPATLPSSFGTLADADVAEGKAWALRVIRALPTTSDLGADDGLI